jgi:hypothetical protein
MSALHILPQFSIQINDLIVVRKRIPQLLHRFLIIHSNHTSTFIFKHKGILRHRAFEYKRGRKVLNETTLDDISFALDIKTKISYQENKTESRGARI